MNTVEKLTTLSWPSIFQSLDRYGCATTGVILDEAECAGLRGLYAGETPFRKRIIMAHHGYGSGEYKYFAYPLPDVVLALREALYCYLAGFANQWHEQLGFDQRFPPEHSEFIAACHAVGQTRPTPLLLRYGPDDYNCLHQDLYGPLVFPLQVVFLLSNPEVDFSGGGFVLTEQRPRSQSRAEVVALRQGEAVIFAVNSKPSVGPRGPRRVTLRHGVSRVIQGERFTLGIIFHDAD